MNSDLVKGWYQKASDEAGIGVLGDVTAILRGPYRVMVTTRDVKAFVQALTRRTKYEPIEFQDNYYELTGLETEMTINTRLGNE